MTEDTVNTQLSGSGELLTSAEMKTAVENAARSTAKGTTGIVTFKDKSSKDKSSIPTTVLNAAAFTATSAGRDIQLKFTTTGVNGEIQGWLIVGP